MDGFHVVESGGAHVVESVGAGRRMGTPQGPGASVDAGRVLVWRSLKVPDAEWGHRRAPAQVSMEGGFPCGGT